jgi:hypothetical protein
MTDSVHPSLACSLPPCAPYPPFGTFPSLWFLPSFGWLGGAAAAARSAEGKKQGEAEAGQAGASNREGERSVVCECMPDLSAPWCRRSALPPSSPVLSSQWSAARFALFAVPVAGQPPESWRSPLNPRCAVWHERSQSRAQAEHAPIANRGDPGFGADLTVPVGCLWRVFLFVRSARNPMLTCRSLDNSCSKGQCTHACDRLPD